MAAALDDRDRRLLDVIQQQIPLVDRPFAAIAQQIGTDEADVLRRLTQLKTPPSAVIRQISAIFDSKSLGYQTCLVATKLDEAKIESAAAIINQHPGVSHNYRRNHDYALWYTLAVPPGSRLGLQGTIDILQKLSGAQAMRLMPSLKLYKIGVKFDVSGEGEVVSRTEPASPGKPAHATPVNIPGPEDQRMIRVLQQDLPLIPAPFDEWARQAQVSVPQLLQAAQNYIETKQMRRFSAVLKHREVGFSANAMGVWVVPPERHDEFGATAASFSAVSHCYLRPSYPDWPYSLFTMVHAPSADECEKVLAAISQATGITDYRSLYSSREFKKIRVRYFTGDIEAWEAQHA